MTHSEIIDNLLKKNNSNYRKFSMLHGLPENYYFVRFKSKETVSPKMFADAVYDLGGRIVAGNGEDLTDMMREERSKTPFSFIVDLIRASGSRLFVSHGDDMYEVTSGINERKNKIK